MSGLDDVEGPAERAIYIAFGFPYLVMAAHSIATLKRTNPGLPITLVTDCGEYWSHLGDVDQEDSLVEHDSSIDPRVIKTSIDQVSQAPRNVFIDCDTEIHGSLRPLLGLLEFFDLAARPQTKPVPGDKGALPLFDGRFQVRDLPHWNSGVIAFRQSAETHAFFERWLSCYRRDESGFDQPPMVEAILTSSAKVCPLNSQWNAGYSEFRKKPDETVILHYTSDIGTKLEKKLLDLGAKLCDSANSKDLRELESFLEKRRQGRLNRGKKVRGYKVQRIFRLARNYFLKKS